MSEESTLRGARICLLVTNDLSGDQRLHRIATTLHQAGGQVTLVGRRLPESLPLSERPYATVRLRLPFRRGKFFYLSYNLAILLWGMLKPVDLWVANDLDTLLGGYLLRRLRRKPLIYDSHEYFTEVPELIDRPKTRAIWLRLERWLLPRLKHSYTVNHSLAQIYRRQYGLDMQVIRNLPFPRPVPPQAEQKQKVLLYQGSLNVGRGLELMIAAMAHLPEGYQLWIVGRGDIADQLPDLVAQHGVGERVKLWGFLPPEELHGLTPQASLGLSLEEDLGGNYHYASPNKVYDYVQAAVPVLVSDLPEMRRLVEEHEVGKVLPAQDRTASGLAACLAQMLEGDAERYAAWKQACRRAAQQLHWNREKERLLTIYEEALRQSRT